MPLAAAKKEQNLYPQKGRHNSYAFLALSLLLYLLGGLLLLSTYGQSSLKQLRESIPFYIELADGANEAEVFRFQKELASQDYIKEGSLQYISKEEALEEMLADGDLKEEDILVLGENLLPNAISFQMKSEALGQYAKQLEALEKEDFVVEVSYAKTPLLGGEDWLSRLSWLSSIFVLFFVLLALTLLRHHLRLQLLSNREQIELLQIVGANPDFLRRPFLQKSIYNGLYCGALASLALLLSIWALGFWPYLSFGALFSNSLLLLAFGLGISWLSSWYSLKKYLAQPLSFWSQEQK